jgi:hypothetical protein
MNAPRRLPAVLVVDDEVRSPEALRRTLEEDFEMLSRRAPRTPWRPPRFAWPVLPRIVDRRN